VDERLDGNDRRWVWRQVWRDVLFLHWRVDAGAIGPHLPPALTIDTWQGDAWVSLVLFRLQVAPIGWPAVSGFSSLVEANLRTYVLRDDQPGIYFFSIHADNLAALTLARVLTPLPYRWASIEYEADRSGCRCRLRRAAKPGCALTLWADYPECGAPPLGERQAWLLERYRAFATGNWSRAVSQLQTATVDHLPWNVQPAAVRVMANTLGRAVGLDLHRPPDDAHFCREMHARFSRFVPCGDFKSHAAARSRESQPA
jgi:uncharacterized protein YqjF (DUF2071 family)